MDFDAIMEWVQDNIPIVVIGGVAIVLLFSMINGNNSEAETVVQPVTEGTSYPTIDANADMIVQQTAENIEYAKKEIIDNIQNEFLDTIIESNASTEQKLSDLINANRNNTNGSLTDTIGAIETQENAKILDSNLKQAQVDFSNIATSTAGKIKNIGNKKPKDKIAVPVGK